VSWRILDCGDNKLTTLGANHTCHANSPDAYKMRDFCCYIQNPKLKLKNAVKMPIHKYGECVQIKVVQIPERFLFHQ